MASFTLHGLHTETTIPITDGSSVLVRPLLAEFPSSILRPTPQRVWVTVAQVFGCQAVHLQPTPQATCTLLPATAYSTARQRLAIAFLNSAPPTGLSLADWFTPMGQLSLDAFDQDLGAGGAAVLVDQTSGPHPHLIIGGGKSQVLYLLDRTNMGHFTSGGPDKVVQALHVSEADFSTPAFWQNTLYFFGFNGPGLAYTFLPDSDTFNPAVGVNHFSFVFVPRFQSIGFFKREHQRNCVDD